MTPTATRARVRLLRMRMRAISRLTMTARRRTHLGAPTFIVQGAQSRTPSQRCVTGGTAFVEHTTRLAMRLLPLRVALRMWRLDCVRRQGCATLRGSIHQYLMRHLRVDRMHQHCARA